MCERTVLCKLSRNAYERQKRGVDLVAEHFAVKVRLFSDVNWNLLPFADPKYPVIEEGAEVPKPNSLQEMLSCASDLSKSPLFIGADFYGIHGECRFGELTLYAESGFGCLFHPDEWNVSIGDWLDPPEPNSNLKFAYGSIVFWIYLSTQGSVFFAMSIPIVISYISILSSSHSGTDKYYIDIPSEWSTLSHQPLQRGFRLCA